MNNDAFIGIKQLESSLASALFSDQRSSLHSHGKVGDAMRLTNVAVEDLIVRKYSMRGLRCYRIANYMRHENFVHLK